MPGRSALVVVDMLNPYEHDDAELLARGGRRRSEPLTKLIARARDEEVAVIYVNDNYGDWASSGKELADHALEGARPDLVKPVLPPEDSAFIVKARHTIFYGTPLDYLLGQREIDHLVLVGQVTEQCILYSALDAYVRHFRVTVPPDGVAHIHEKLADAALEMMRRNMKAELSDCADCRLSG